MSGEKLATSLPRLDLPVFCCRIPVNRHAVKKNGRTIHINRKTGNRFIGKSQALSSAEQYLIAHLIKARNDAKIFVPISYDIHAMFRFYFSDFWTKEDRRNLTLPDLSNLVCLPEDCLQEAGIIVNDRQIASLDGSRRLPGSTDILEIKIWPFKEFYGN